MQRLLFLCTANYYRSRFAEIFFNWHAAQRSLPWKAESRGMIVDPGNPGMMFHETRARLGTHGIPLTEYERLPLAVTTEDLAAAQHVIAVKRTEHHPAMQWRFPDWVEKVEFWEVHDIDCSLPRDSLPHLEKEVLALIERLAAKQQTNG